MKHRVPVAQQHQQVPFEQVVEATNPSRSAAVTSLFQVMFAWQDHDIGDLKLPGLPVAAEPIPWGDPDRGSLLWTMLLPHNSQWALSSW